MYLKELTELLRRRKFTPGADSKPEYVQKGRSVPPSAVQPKADASSSCRLIAAPCEAKQVVLTLVDEAVF
jgi:hypothetical protein